MAEIASNFGDITKSDGLGKNEFVKEENIGISLEKRESLASLKHPLSSSCARHGTANDFLPSEILANLTSQYETFEDLGPQSNAQLKRGKQFSKLYPRRPHNNLWNHSRTRERFKHLTEQPPCTCGAGRDISFLYDAVSNNKVSSNGSQDRKSPKKVANAILPSKDREETNGALQDGRDTAMSGRIDQSKIPESLLPIEFHIVKNPGVLGLEIHEEKFTTTMKNHEKHQTLFPSMKPSGRQEAILLKKTMEDLLARAGVGDFKLEKDQPTQIHGLLDLVKQEQNIYNVIFSEIIRQVTVDCVERGELLADLRKRYANLLDKVPRYVKSLHEEVLAQRALDRRLTEELTRFKTSITLLTRELDSVQEHDREVTKQAADTQIELNEALKESEKNASLLAEYHELYELQRRRLEFQISKLIEERDLWAGSSYTLSLKVTRKNNLRTAKRLYLHEKAWHKLADHFAIVLSDIDSIHLQKLTNNVQQWQEVAEAFHYKLITSEKETHRKLSSLRKQIRYWGKQFERVVTPTEGTVHTPARPTIAKLYEDMKHWEEVFNSEVERFSGDVLLSCEDDLLKMNDMVDNWSGTALKIFRRHPNKPADKNRPEHDSMLALNKDIEKLHKNFKSRMTGENGLAKGIIHFINVLDSLGSRLNSYSIGAEVILDPEWVRLADFLQNEWEELLSELIELVSPEEQSDGTNETGKKRVQMSVDSVGKSAHKWVTATAKSIENVDASILDHVSSNHSDMIRWMVTILLRLAPDLADDSLEENEDSGNIGIGAAIISQSMTEEIQKRAKMQFRRLRQLTNELFNCCSGIVNENIKGIKEGSSGVDEIDIKELNEFKAECNGWISTAKLLVEEFSGDRLNESDNEGEDEQEDPLALEATNASEKDKEKTFSEEAQSEEDTSQVSIVDGKEKPDVTVEEKVQKDRRETPKEGATNDKSTCVGESSDQGDNARKSSGSLQMHIIGHDENMEVKVLDAASISKEISRDADKDPLLRQTSTIKDLETIEKLQEQLVETEERAQSLEERAIAAESSLKEAMERIRALERGMRRASQDTTSTSQPANSELPSLPETNSNDESLSKTPKSRGSVRTLSRESSRGTSKSAGSMKKL